MYSDLLLFDEVPIVLSTSPRPLQKTLKLKHFSKSKKVANIIHPVRGSDTESMAYAKIIINNTDSTHSYLHFIEHRGQST